MNYNHVKYFEIVALCEAVEVVEIQNDNFIFSSRVVLPEKIIAVINKPT